MLLFLSDLSHKWNKNEPQWTTKPCLLAHKRLFKQHFILGDTIYRVTYTHYDSLVLKMKELSFKWDQDYECNPSKCCECVWTCCHLLVTSWTHSRDSASLFHMMLQKGAQLCFITFSVLNRNVCLYSSVLVNLPFSFNITFLFHVCHMSFNYTSLVY